MKREFFNRREARYLVKLFHMIKYESVKLKAVDLQAYLEDYFQRKLIFNMKDHNRKEVKFRRIVMFIFNEFTSLSQARIAERLKVDTGCVHDAVVDKNILKDHDLKFILKELRGELDVHN